VSRHNTEPGGAKEPSELSEPLASTGDADAGPSDAQYQLLLDFRNALRRFDHWSQSQAAAVGLTHAQHQLLLAIRGSRSPGGPAIGEVAEALMVRHHSASELVDRTQEAGLVARERDPHDSRRVRLHLTDAGLEVLGRLTEVHRGELRELAAALSRLSA